jgi:hypothetical protein
VYGIKCVLYKNTEFCEVFFPLLFRAVIQGNKKVPHVLFLCLDLAQNTLGK